MSSRFPPKESLRAYFYSLSVLEREAFALACATSVGYIQQMINGIRDVQAETAMRFEIASQGALRAEDICTSAPWDRWLYARKARQRRIARRRIASA